MWRLLPYANIWSLWLHRKDIIFQGKTVDVAQLFFSVKTRAAWWWKALSADSNIHLDSLICDPSLASSKADAYFSSPANVVWTPLPCGFLKFNVDGACSKEGLCGVGGVLRDPQGSILLEFSQSIGVGSVLLAEILAIKIAVERFVNSPWVKRWRLIVESDSKSAVEWISTPSVANPLFRQLVGSIYTFFSGWSLVYQAYSKRTECDSRFTGQGGYWLRSKVVTTTRGMSLGGEGLVWSCARVLFFLV
ncbi:hypothetical protein V6N11_039116 [Hibiscus sabdariffa]|uniref:RNase H type-1 domain-containing protein n=1 Tax=Hibiscus sabdariffa TaxID=183260 RepID=A0ABR2SMU9_9ROSI